jgi:hypothetical protein
LYHPNTTSSFSSSPAGDDTDHDNTPELENEFAFTSNDNIDTNNTNNVNTPPGALPPSPNANLFPTIPIALSDEQVQHMRNTLTPQQIEEIRQRMEFLRSNMQGTSTDVSVSNASSLPSLFSSFSSSSSSSSSVPPDLGPVDPISVSLIPWPRRIIIRNQNQEHNQNQSALQIFKPLTARALIAERINSLQNNLPLSHTAVEYLARLKVVQEVQKRLEGARARRAESGLDAVIEVGGDNSSQSNMSRPGPRGSPGRALPVGRVLALDKLKVVRTARYPHPNNNSHCGPRTSQTELRITAEPQQSNPALPRGICHFCTPGMSSDFGITEHAPKETIHGLDTADTRSVNIWALPGEKICKACSTYNLHTAPNPSQPPTRRPKILSQIDNHDITSFMPNLQCRCCVWRLLDVAKVQICAGCKGTKMGIVRHGRHLEFEDVGTGAGREARCMVCVRKAEYKCKGCELRVCEGCREALVRMCE